MIPIQMLSPVCQKKQLQVDPVNRSISSMIKKFINLKFAGVESRQNMILGALKSHRLTQLIDVVYEAADLRDTI